MKRNDDDVETVLGRNPVLECLRAGVPATALYVALGAQADERLTESVTLAADSGIAILEVPRTDLDRMTTNGLHQGIALQVPPYKYLHPDELLKMALDNPPALLVALDNISDPRNLGAIVRSVAAFGGHGVLIPRAAVRLGDGGGLADQRRRGRADSRRARHQSQSDTEGLGRSRGCSWSGWTPKATRSSTMWTAPVRWWWWSDRKAKGCPGWCVRTAMRWCRFRWPARPNR